MNESQERNPNGAEEFIAPEQEFEENFTNPEAESHYQELKAEVSSLVIDISSEVDRV